MAGSARRLLVRPDPIPGRGDPRRGWVNRPRYQPSVPRVITLPTQGVLVAATDLHGNLGDFRTVVARFRALQNNGMDPLLVVCGDLVHGPAIPVAAWPEHLGTYYQDQTPELLEEA